MGKEFEIICGIYKIISPSDKVYIGQSTNCLKRWERYKHGSANQRKLHNSIKKYGRDTHSFEIIHICSEMELNKFEIYYGELFDCYNSQTGLNIRKCGGSKGKLAEESIDKMKKTWKEKRDNGYVSLNKGRRTPEETKKKQSEAKKKKYQNGYVSPRKGVPVSESVKQKLREANIGNTYSIGAKRTDDQKIKIVAALKRRWKRIKENGGFKQSDEHREKRLEKIRGSKRTEEQKIKMRKPRSEEAKKNIRAAMERNKKPKEGTLVLNVENGIFYNSINEASRSYNIHPNTIAKNLNKNNYSFISA